MVGLAIGDMRTRGAMNLEPGRSFEERYRIERILGAGASATVYLARDMALNSMAIALKCARIHTSDDEVIARYRDETAIARSLSHPHIVNMYEFGISEDGVPYQTMELVEGETVAERLEDGVLGDAERLAILRAVLEALAHAHGRGVVHRDLKPSNIFLGNDGAIKLGDFGIARAMDEAYELTRTGELMGTIAYMSPQRLRGEKGVAADDIFAFGLLCFQLFTGEPPSRGGDVATVLQEYQSGALTRRLKSKGRDANQWVEIIALCCASEREHRPTAQELLPGFIGERIVAPAALLGARNARRMRRAITRLLVAAILCIAGVFGLLRAPPIQPNLLAQLVLFDLQKGPVIYQRLRSWAGVDEFVPTNEQLLNYFVEYERPRALQRVLQSGVSANKPNASGFAPVCVVNLRTGASIAKVLLEHGADPNIDCFGPSLFNRALELGEASMVQLLFDHGVKRSEQLIIEALRSPVAEIREAAYDGWKLSASMLIAPDTTLLEWSIGENIVDAFALLIAREPDPQSLTIRSVPLLIYLVVVDRPQMVRLLLKRLKLNPLVPQGVYATPVMFACVHGRIAVLRMFREMGIDLKSPDSNLITPADYAIRYRQYFTADRLVAWGGSLNVEVKGAQRPLMNYLEFFPPEATAVALRLGADPTLGDPLHVTPLLWSMVWGKWSHLALLVSRGGRLIDIDRWLLENIQPAQRAE